MTTNPVSRSGPLGALMDRWTTEATHPAMPGVVVRGTATVEWLEGERFLTLRSRTDHSDFSNFLAVIGDMGPDRVGSADGAIPSDADASRLRMHYFDSRGVFRVYEVSMDRIARRWWRDAPGLSQRFTGIISADGTTIAKFYTQKRQVVPARAIPKVMRQAIISIEDRRFLEHHGVDPEALLRAKVQNKQAGETVEGGSPH